MVIYDAHTHRQYGKNEEVVAIHNQELDAVGVLEGYFSVGVHPAKCEGVVVDEVRQRLLEYAKNRRCVAIGECGLDRRYGSFEAQKRLFEVHVEVATQTKLPLIIHCVKALGEVLAVSRGCGVPRVLHAWGRWDRNIEVAGDIYLSVGYRNLLRVQNIPLNRVLLESDDTQNSSIEEIYEKFAELRGLKILELNKIIEENFKRIFLCK